GWPTEGHRGLRTPEKESSLIGILLASSRRPLPRELDPAILGRNQHLCLEIVTNVGKVEHDYYIEYTYQAAISAPVADSGFRLRGLS
ncbi:uncharacterized protein METZ01_LOCUS461694, partial [marine metagenome]